jgi:hypothetical protein
VNHFNEQAFTSYEARMVQEAFSGYVAPQSLDYMRQHQILEDLQIGKVEIRL